MAKKKANKKNTRSLHIYLMWSLVGIVFLLYGKSLGFDFALDDSIVITDNEFTQKGIAGIPDIFKYDTFRGFFGVSGKDDLVSGGRYRPFSLAEFAVERSLFGTGPFFHHLMNLIYYALTIILIYLLGFQLLGKYYQGKKLEWLAFFVALLFAVHPVHTEVVANIKGRDEILAFLCSLFVLYSALMQSEKGLKFKDYLLISFVFFIGLLSKENAITYVLVVPMFMYWLNRSTSQIFKVTAFLFGTSMVFILLRSAVIGWDFGSSPSLEFMNNPYLKVEDGQYVFAGFSERLMTILVTMWKYIQLLFVPYPLTHDYYPNHIELQTQLGFESFLGLFIIVCLVGMSMLGILRKKIWGYICAYFLITISIVSNVVFPIGTHMSERFLYMPSLAFALGLPLLIYSILNSEKTNKIVLGIIAFSFAMISFIRMDVWKDNYTLFTSDVQVSENSAKVNNAAAGVILDNLDRFSDESARIEKINKAIKYAEKAISIHPRYINAYLLKGNGYFYLNEYEQAIAAYNQCLVIDPVYQDALNNTFLAYRSAGRYYGEVKNDLSKSLQYLIKAESLRPGDFETNRLLGTCYGILGNHSLAVNYFQKCVDLDPNNPAVIVNLAKAYELTGDQQTAQRYYNQAKQLESKN